MQKSRLQEWEDGYEEPNHSTEEEISSMINIYSYFQAGRSSEGSNYFNDNDHVDETLQSVHSPVPLSPTNELADAPCHDPDNDHVNESLQIASVPTDG